MISTRSLLVAIGCAATIVAAGMAQRQPGASTVAVADRPLPTGELLYETVVSLPGSPNIRVAFDQPTLAEGAFVLITSALDGGWQRLDAVSMAQWRNRSAIFNGDTLVVQVFVSPDDSQTDVAIGGALSNTFTAVGATPETVCGGDDRTASNDNRIGRLLDCPDATCTCPNGCQLGVCTAWRSANETFLTAGHCTIEETPDIVEFNVPASASNGNLVLADPSHQYPVDLASIVDNDNGLGEDWAVFDVFPNSNTGLMPHEAYGVGFRLSRETPPGNSGIRITGFGSDDGTSNFTNQTSVGPYKDEYIGGPSDIDHEYFTDTEGGNSGGPIIWDAFGVAIGIHTHSGCVNPLANDGNLGTSFEVDILENALASRWGVPVRFVDGGHALPANYDGTVYRPYNTVAEGVAACPDNGMVAIVAGSYPASSGNTFFVDRPMQLVAHSGAVLIGN